MMSRGTTLVLAMLILWLILGAATGVATLLIGELKISGEVDVSVVALYGADTGVECFLYKNRIAAGTVCDASELSEIVPTKKPSYDKFKEVKTGAVVELAVTGGFRETNRGLEVRYQE